MEFEPFPYLAGLLGGYFDQDAYTFGDTDEDIVRDFQKTSWDYQRIGVQADIRRLLHEHGDHLLEVMQEAFAPAVIIGRTDDEARAWLQKIDKLLAEPVES
ncbi:MAG TPA: contact-dependent growth inhibition system immunity protein [Bryobacteraceae bacterium]|nr:contact-dependent growth inhibition system immunity protein [Bryobacteraceae bacterium]